MSCFNCGTEKGHQGWCDHKLSLGWVSEALCGDLSIDPIGPMYSSEIREVKRVCQRCPVRIECLHYALENREELGIYGGKTPDERRSRRAELLEKTRQALGV